MSFELSGDDALALLEHVRKLGESLDSLPYWAEEAIGDIYDVRSAFRELNDDLGPLRAIEARLREDRFREVSGSSVADFDGWLTAFEQAKGGKDLRFVVPAGDFMPGHTIVSDGTAALAVRGLVSPEKQATYFHAPDIETIVRALDAHRPRAHKGRLRWSDIAGATTKPNLALLVRRYDVAAGQESPREAQIGVDLNLARAWLLGIVSGRPSEPIDVEFDDPDERVGPIRFTTTQGVAWVMRYRIEVDVQRRIELDPEGTP